MADADNFETTYKRYQETQTKANELNKAAVFHALAEAGIQRVTVTFDGEGDSGQTDEAIGYKNDEAIGLPESSLTIHAVAWGSETITGAIGSLSEAIESLCFGYLSEAHGGWENNDGGFGEFTFHVSERRIELEFNARYSDSTQHCHTF